MTVTVATLKGSRATISVNLRNHGMTIRGDVLRPRTPDMRWSAWRTIAMHPGKPALVVRPTGTADVVGAVNFARDNGLSSSPSRRRSLGRRTLDVDGGLLHRPRPDEPRRRRPGGPDGARPGRGARLATWTTRRRPSGSSFRAAWSPSTGVAGLTLGGGEGWVRLQARAVGSRTILSAQRVGADGQVRTASADSNRSVRRPRGWRRLGAATWFTFQCHPVGPMVAFAVFIPWRTRRTSTDSSATGPRRRPTRSRRSSAARRSRPASTTPRRSTTCR